MFESVDCLGERFDFLEIEKIIFLRHGPERRIIAIAPVPGGVAIAAIVVLLFKLSKEKD